MDGFGLNFAPTDQAGSGPNKPPAEPLQQAIQMLSLRLPHVVGAQGIAPGPLLNSPGGSPILELLARLFGQGHQGPGMPGMPGMAPSMPGGAPMPSIHPGASSPPQGPITSAPPPTDQAGTLYDRGSGGSVYPKGPWSDFPMPTQPFAPAPSAPAPMAAPGPQRDWLGSFGKNY